MGRSCVPGAIPGQVKGIVFEYFEIFIKWLLVRCSRSHYSPLKTCSLVPGKNSKNLGDRSVWLLSTV